MRIPGRQLRLSCLETKRGKAEIVWTCAEEGWWVIEQRMLNMELPDRKRKRFQKRFNDAVTWRG